MNALAVTSIDALASPPEPGTSVSVVATFIFNGQTIVINTGDITKGVSNLNFSLNNPVVLGSFNDFINWLNNQFGVPLTGNDINNAIKQIPTTPAALNDIRNALLGLVNGVVTVTVLNVNVAAGTFQVGISYAPTPPVTILGIITFSQLGVMVTKTGAVSSP